MKLSDAQWGALWQIVSFGPITAEEIIMPKAMDGSQRVKLQCHYFSAATLSRLEGAGFVTVQRCASQRPVSATGQAGHRRNTLTIDITDAGRAKIETKDAK